MKTIFLAVAALILLFAAAARIGGLAGGSEARDREFSEINGVVPGGERTTGDLADHRCAALHRRIARRIAETPLDVRWHLLQHRLAGHCGPRGLAGLALLRGMLASPADPQLAFLAGRQVVEQGRAREGLNHFRRSLMLGNDHLDEIFEYGMTLFNGHYPLFQEVFPRVPAVRQRVALLLHQRGLTEQSVAEYRWCVGQCPDNAEYRHRLAIGLSRLGDLSGAEEALDAALERAPASRVYLLEKAKLFHRQGRFDEAADRCRALIVNDPGREDAYLLLGQCLRRAGRFRELVPILREAMWRVERRDRLLLLLGDGYLAEDRPGEALTCYEQCLEETGDRAVRKNALYQSGLALIRLGRREEARRVLAEARSLPVEGRDELDRKIDDTLLELDT